MTRVYTYMLQAAEEEDAVVPTAPTANRIGGARRAGAVTTHMVARNLTVLVGVHGVVMVCL
jgi:hypothetical protein